MSEIDVGRMYGASMISVALGKPRNNMFCRNINGLLDGVVPSTDQ